MEIDLRTTAILLSTINLLQVFALFVQYRVNRTYHGPGWWVLGTAAWSLAFAFNSMRQDSFLGAFAIVANNLAFAVGMALVYVGTLRFFDRREPRVWLYALCGITTILAVYFTYVDENTIARRINFSTTQAILSFLIFHSLYTYKPPSIRASANMLAGIFLANGIFFALRTVTPFVDPERIDLFSATFIQTATYLFALITSTLWTLGFIIMINQRLSEESREDKENLERIFNTTPDSLLITRLDDGMIVSINDSFTALTGFTRHDAVGKRSRQINLWKNPTDRQRLIDALDAAGVCDNLEVVFRRKDGSELIGMLSARPITLQGEPHIISVTRDITERKQTEEALRQSEEKFKSLANLLPQIIFETDASGNLTYVNQQAFTVMGYADGEQVIGMPSLTFHVPEERAKVIGNIQRKLAGHPVGNPEYTMQRKDGSTFPALVYSNPILVDGKPAGLRGIIVDITERKQAEAALQASNNRISQLLETTDQGIYGLDIEGRCTFINQSGLKMLGYSPEACLGQNMHDLIHHSHADGSPYAQEACPIFRAKATGVGCRIAHEVLWRSDGTAFPAEYSSYPIIEDGQIQGAVVTFSDITARRQAEDAIRTANQELAATNVALETAIAHASEMAHKAEAANIAKSEFLANMSHEIRTPLNGVLGMAALLLDTALDDEQHHYADAILSSAESLLSVINDILDFSKIEAGKLDLEDVDFDLHSLLDDLMTALSLRAHQKGLELLCHIQPDVPLLLRGDPGRLRQILTNLAGNAIKFTHAGEVAVDVALEEEDPAEVLLRFVVRDTGIGMPADKLKLLFQKFTQLDSSTRRQFGGTGLGLAISKQLVEMMGGAVGVNSTVDEGSTFWFTARLGIQPAARHVQPPAPDPMQAARILVVDDNATHRTFLCASLERWGMHPSGAADGPSALHTLQEAAAAGQPFPVALIDMQMPGMDGLALGSAVKADRRLMGTQMVAMVSLLASDTIPSIRTVGFAAYVMKPIRHHDLQEVLTAVLVRAAPGNATQIDGSSSAPSPGHHTSHNTLRHAAASPPLPKGLFAGSAVRILIVEDNVTNQKVALGILKKLGLSADIAGNGAEALEKLAGAPYDLVLMDVQMPVMDGLEATRGIRALPATNPNRAIPVIAMTAEAMQGDQEKCLAAGMDDYISKPIRSEMLVERLHTWLQVAPHPDFAQARAAEE